MFVAVLKKQVQEWVFSKNFIFKLALIFEKYID